MEFRTIYGGCKKTQVDASNPMVKQYMAVEPYAVDSKTGECLNPSPSIKLIEVESINVQERIQSFARECDLYTILERYALSGDESLLNRNVMSFADIVGIPDNKNDFNEFIQAHIIGLSKTNPEIAKQLLKNDIDYNSIKKMIDESVANALLNQAKNNIEVGGSNE